MSKEELAFKYRKNMQEIFDYKSLLMNKIQSIIEETNKDITENKVRGESLKSDIKSLLDKFSERDVAILCLKIGYNNKPISTKALATQFSLTAEEVVDIVKKCLLYLKEQNPEITDELIEEILVTKKLIN